MHQLDEGRVSPELATTMTGLTEFASHKNVLGIFCQNVDDEATVLTVDVNEPVFTDDSGPSASVMDVLAFWERIAPPEEVARPGLHNVCLDLGTSGPLRWKGKWIRRLMLTFELRRKVIHRHVHFFAYDEVFPTSGRQGMIVRSHIDVQGSGVGELSLVMIPVGTQDVRIQGQLDFDI